MSKLILKIPKGILSLLLIISGALRSLFISQMGFNLSAIQMASYGFKSNVASLIITVVFVGLIYALAVRLVILIGYRIARRAYVGKITPGISETQMMPINYVEFRSISMGYLIVAGFVSALLNIPMFLYPLSMTLCRTLMVYIEVAAIIVMAFDMMKNFEPKACKRAVSAFIIPFGIFLVLRVIAGV